MAWRVIEYMDQNPQSSPIDVLRHFADEYQVDEQQENLRIEVEKVQEIREQLRPLYAEKMEKETQLTLMDSDFDMQVMIKYPPRKGSDKERKSYKLELQEQDETFQTVRKEVEGLKEQILLLEEETGDIQQKAKNARRLLETFNNLISFLNGSTNQAAHFSSEEASNHNAF